MERSLHKSGNFEPEIREMRPEDHECYRMPASISSALTFRHGSCEVADVRNREVSQLTLPPHSHDGRG